MSALLLAAFLLTLLITGIRLVICASNFFSSIYLKPGKPESKDKVSVLIPLRNEEHQLAGLIQALKRINYPDYEVLLINDASEDNTLNKCYELTESDSRFKVMNAPPLPGGWKGKPHACHLMAKEAIGDYLLFTDADVRPGETLIHDALSMLKKDNSDLISVSPVQIMQTPGEWCTVPNLHILMLSFLYLPWVRDVPGRHFAAAIGQFMLFSASNYHANQWHKQVASCVTEDVEIMKKLKSSGYRGSLYVSSSRDQLSCRMYHGFTEAVRGMGKNIVEVFMHSNALLILYLVFAILMWPIYLIYLPVFLWFPLLALILLLKIMISVMARQSILKNLIYHPLQVLTFVITSIYSIVATCRKRRTWKGRQM